MRIKNKPSFVELVTTEVVPSGLPSAGDVRVEVKASIDGFIGSGACWIEEPTLRAFATSCKQLLSSFQGSAHLESISPGEFSLSLSPANSRGYILVQVAISKSAPYTRSTSGAFECELSAMSNITSWSEKPHEYA